MTKHLAFFTFALLAFSCKSASDKKDTPGIPAKTSRSSLYSETVKDSFSIFVGLPNEYDAQKAYPVVYLLDANLYFDIMAVTIGKYAEVGLAPEVILVGIGYKDFQTMDSLRCRDYTFPTAIPEYEMSVSGGAEKFLAFIKNELFPYIDRKYKTDASKRILAGHSLGGYLSTYALLQDLQGQTVGFSGYIAASPSVEYNKYYILNQLKTTPTHQSTRDKIKAYITFGGMEDDEGESDTSALKLSALDAQLANLITVKQSNHVDFKLEIFSNLDHMDTPIPTFIKGLQWVLGDEK